MDYITIIAAICIVVLGCLNIYSSTYKNSQGSGLQLLQSKMAIGSGRIMGSGFLKGTQFKNIPENHTDFIFAVLGEGCGFIGVIILLFLY